MNCFGVLTLVSETLLVLTLHTFQSNDQARYDAGRSDGRTSDILHRILRQRGLFLSSQQPLREGPAVGSATGARYSVKQTMVAFL